MKQSLFTILFLSAAISLSAQEQPDPNVQFRNKVVYLLTEYMQNTPEAHLRDVYKLCFQDVYGVAHLVPDTAVAARYLASELALVDTADQAFPDYEYTLPDSHYVRLNLRVVADGRVPASLLLQFLSASAATPPYMSQPEWRHRWNTIQTLLSFITPRPGNFDEDAKEIKTLLDQGEYVTHHSRHFNDTYRPHYRIIRRDLFEQQILPLL